MDITSTYQSSQRRDFRGLHDNRAAARKSRSHLPRPAANCKINDSPKHVGSRLYLPHVYGVVPWDAIWRVVNTIPMSSDERLHLTTDADGVVAGECKLGLVIDFDRLHIVKS